jgi:hypothetical protein
VSKLKDLTLEFSKDEDQLDKVLLPFGIFISTLI